MLSPHEFAALMLIGDPKEANWPDLGSDNLAALVERQLVHLEHRTSGLARPRLTCDGLQLLQQVRALRKVDR